MDLDYLKRNASQFAYQLRKFFPEGESPINHYICENHLVVLSTKKLYIYFYEKYIDYVEAYFEESNVSVVENNGCIVNIDKKVFHLKFEREVDSLAFYKYYLKYKE